MSLAGEHIPFNSVGDDDREAGIFSTISVPTPTTRPEPASIPTANSGTLPFLDGILGDLASDAVASEEASLTSLMVSSTIVGSLSGSSTIPGGSAVVSSTTTIPDTASSTAVIKAGPSTIFTTIPISSTLDSTPASLATSAASEPEHMSNNANIMLPSSKLFPLGVVAVILGGLVMLVLSILLVRRCSKRRRQRRLGDRILSISSDIGNAPYPFDAKAYDDDIESRYPTMPTNSPPRLAPVVGIASSFPSQFETEVQGRFDNTIKGEYTQTVRARAGVIHDRPDTFTCAMYPAGTCPIEHEISTNTPIITDRDRGGSPVPSFNTGRLDDQPMITTHQSHVGKLLTPPQPPQQPKYKSKHVPAPLMISPSINEGTNSVRGLTFRKSTISVGSAYTGI